MRRGDSPKPLLSIPRLGIGVSLESHLYPRELLMGCSITSSSHILKEKICMVLKQCNSRWLTNKDKGTPVSAVAPLLG